MINLITQLRTLVSDQGIKRYAENTSWMMGEKVLRMFLGIFVSAWVARYLGPQQFGLLSYAQSFIFLFTAISTLGLDSIVVRELIKDDGRRDKLMGSAFGLKFFGAVILLPMLAIAVNFTDNDNFTNLLIYIIASATVFQSFNVIDFYFQSKVLSKYAAIANSISFGLSSVIKIGLILNEAPLIVFAFMAIFDVGILACGLVYFYYKKTNIFKSMEEKQLLIPWKYDWHTAKGLLKDSWPLMLSTLVISIYMKIDQVMIKDILGYEAVGQYAAAVRLSEAWYFIPVAIVNSLFPAIVNARETNGPLYLRRLQNLYTLMVWLAIAVALVISFWGGWLVKTLYGEIYMQAADVLVVHIWAGVFVFLGVAFSSYLVAENLPRKAFYRTLLGATINVILNLILIPSYGLLGAATATFLGQLTANVIYDIFDKSLWPQLRLKFNAFIPIYIFKD